MKLDNDPDQKRYEVDCRQIAPAEIAEIVSEYGFAVLRNALGPKILNPIRERATLFYQFIIDAGADILGDVERLERLGFNARNLGTDLANAVSQKSNMTFLRDIRESSLGHLLRLLCDNELRFTGHDLLRFVPRQFNLHRPSKAHNDSLLPFDGFVYVVWIPLTPDPIILNREAAGLEILHNRLAADGSPEYIAPRIKFGDALIFDGYITHRTATRPKWAHWRLSVDIRISKLGAAWNETETNHELDVLEEPKISPANLTTANFEQLEKLRVTEELVVKLNVELDRLRDANNDLQTRLLKKELNLDY